MLYMINTLIHNPRYIRIIARIQEIGCKVSKKVTENKYEYANKNEEIY